MAYTVQFRRGTTAEHSTFTGEKGELTFDTTTNRLVVHDGTTVSGIAIAKLSDIPTDLAQLTDTTSLITEAWQAKLAKTNKDYKTLYMPSVRNMSLNTDGTKVYVVDNRYVYEYDLSIANDLSTAVLQGSYYYYTPLTNDESHMVEISGNGAHLYLASTSSGIIYQFDLATPYDITTISNPSKSINLVSEENKTLSMEMNSTGTKMWTTGGTTDEVHQYTLSTPYDITTVAYDDVQFNLNTAAGITTAQSIVISIDGSKMYVFDSSFDELFEFDLSSSYDISTATYNGISTWINGASHATVSPDGSKLYASEGSVVVQYSLTANTDDIVTPTASSTTWNLDTSSLSYDSKTLSVGSSRQVALSEDGTKMYVPTNRYIQEYDLTIPYDISTASYVNQFYYYSAIASDETSFIDISSNGEHVYLTNDSHDQIEQLTMSTPYDITTAGTRKTINISHLEIQPTGISFSPDGKKFIMVGINNDRVYEFVCSTPWDISTSYWTGARTYVGLQCTSPRSCSYSSDGTKMYVFQDNGTIFEYQLSTPFAVATANINNPGETTSFGRTLYYITISKNGKYVYGSDGTYVYQYKIDGSAFSGVSITPSGTTWDFDKNSIIDDYKTIAVNGAIQNSKISIDGTKMFVMREYRYVQEYALSTSFDISTATYTRQFDVYPTQGNDNSTALEFASDGSKFYTIDYDSDIIYEWTMATPWDLTSVSNSGTYSINTHFTNGLALVMSHDGKKMYITGNTSDKIAEFILTTAFDITTAYWTGSQISVSTQTTEPRSLMLSSDGSKLYLKGNSNTQLYEYSMPTAYDLGTAVYNETITIPSMSEYMSISHDGKYIYGTSSGMGWYLQQFRSDGTAHVPVTITSSGTTWDFDKNSIIDDYKTIAVNGTISNSQISVDGTKMFVMREYRYVQEYALSTSFDISTATYTRQFDVYPTQGNDNSYALEFASDGSKFYTIDYDSDLIYEWTMATPWDLTSVTNSGTYAIGAHFTNGIDLAMTYDGKKMYIVGNTSHKIAEFILTTAFDITTAYWTGNQLSVSTQTIYPRSLMLSSDGSKLYLKSNSNTQLYEYSMLTAYDLGTAVYNETIIIPSMSEYMSMSHDGKYIYGISSGMGWYLQQFRSDGTAHVPITITSSGTTWDFDKNSIIDDKRTISVNGAIQNSQISVDGTKMFVMREYRYVQEYALSTPFDISTATYTRQFDVYPTQGNDNSYTLEVASDGSKFYTIDYDSDVIYEWTMATPWDLTSVSNSGTYAIGAHFTNGIDLVMTYDGKKMYITGNTSHKIAEFILTTPFDITTAYWTGSQLSVSTQTIYPRSLMLSSDGSKLYLKSNSNTQLYEYSMSTAYDLSSAIYESTIIIPSMSEYMSMSHDGKYIYGISSGMGWYLQQFRSDGTAHVPVTITSSGTTWDFDKTSIIDDKRTIALSHDIENSQISVDGTKMFVMKGTRYVTEYTLSTPFDVGSATYIREFDVYPTQGSDNSAALEVASDGSKFYTIDYDNDYIYEWTMAAPWDLTSVTNSGIYAIGAHFTNPWDLVMTYDGKKVYVTGYDSDKIAEFVLTTPFDITTAYWTGSQLSVGTQTSYPRSLMLSSDGSKLYLKGNSNTQLYEYSMSTAYDLSSAIYESTIIIPTMDYTSMSHDGKYIYGRNMTISGKYLQQFRSDGTAHVPVSITSSGTAWSFDADALHPSGTIGTGFDSDVQNISISVDGTKMFMMNASRYVKEYTLSTPFDTTTATYIQQFDVYPTQGSDFSFALEVTSDGSKFYTIDYDSDYIYEWTMAAPWDLTSVTNSGIYYIGQHLTNAFALVMTHDGKKVYVTGYDSDKISEFVLNTPFDITTAYWTGNQISTSSQTDYPRSLILSSDGSKLYLKGNTLTQIYEYSMPTAYDLGTAIYTRTITIVTSVNCVTTTHDGSILYGVSPYSGSASSIIEFDMNADTSSVQSFSLHAAPWVSPSSETSNSNFNFYVNAAETLFVGTDGSSIFSRALDSDANLGKMSGGSAGRKDIAVGSGVTSVALSEAAIPEEVSSDWSSATLEYTLSNPDPDGDPQQDEYARSVAISGDYAIVGVPGEANYSGKAYIYNATTSTLLYTLNNPNPYSAPGNDWQSQNDQFGCSVAISGDYAIVGAKGEDDASGLDSGKAYIFNATTGTIVHTLNNPNGYGTSANDYFGHSVSISGDYAIVGAYGEDDATDVDYSGKAYIYNVTSGLLVHTLNNPTPFGTSNVDIFGYSVAISGDHAIVGAYAEDDADGDSSGKAYIFNVTSGLLVHTLDNPNPFGTSTGDNFGRAVAISDNYAIVGAWSEADAGGSASGKAYIFNVNSGLLVHTLDNPTAYLASANDYFSISVAISGDYAIVGATGEDDADGDDSGKAYIYNVTSGLLVHTFNNPNTNWSSDYDAFSNAVAISGDRAIVGAVGEQLPSGEYSGYAYIFSVPSTTNPVASASGEEMYVLKTGSNTITQYTLSTPGDISTATSTSTFTCPAGIIDFAFSSDGTRVYMMNSTEIQQFDLSTPWAITSASLATNGTFDMSNEITNPYSLQLTENDTTLNVHDGNTYVKMHRFVMTTPKDITTIAYDAFAQYLDGAITKAFVSSDGTNVIVRNSSDNSFRTFYVDVNNIPQLSFQAPAASSSVVISTPLVSMKKTLDYSMNANDGFHGFVDDGNKFVTTNGGTITVHDVSTPYDITTGTPGASATYNMSPYNPGIESAKFSADGTKLYLKYNYYYQNNDKSIREITCTSPFNPNGVVASTYNFGSAIYDFDLSYDGTALYVLFQDKNIYQYGLATTGSIESKYGTNITFNAATLDSNPRTIQISDDGTKMFVFGITDDRVHQLDMTSAYMLSSATYNGVKTDVISNASRVYITNDGSRLNAQISSTSRVEAYSINGDLATVVSPTPGTAWSGDISTPLVSMKKTLDYSMNANDGFHGFVDDGNKFVTTSGGTITVHDVSTPYDITTGTPGASATYNMSPYNPGIERAKFSPDGTKLYLKYNYYYQDNDKNIREITCTSPFNPNGVVAGTFQGDTQSIYGGVYDMCTAYDTTKMYILNHNEIIYEYVMVTPGSIASMYWTGASFNAATLDTNPRTIQISDDGTKMFVFGITDDRVHQLDMTTAFDFSSATYNGVKTDVISNASVVYITNDGSRLNAQISSTSRVEAYSINGDLATIVSPTPGTAWSGDISTSLVSMKKTLDYSMNANDGFQGFVDNGNKFVTTSGGTITVHDVSTPYDITTGTPGTSATHNMSPYNPGIERAKFSPDGTKLYLKYNYYYQNNDKLIREITCTSPFNPNGTIAGTFQGDTQSIYGDGVYDMCAAYDTTKMYILNHNEIIYEYVMTIPGSIASMYWTGVSFNAATLDTNPRTIQISDDGTKMFVFGITDDRVHQLDMTTAFDFATATYNGVKTDVISNASVVYITNDGSRLNAQISSTSRVEAYSINGDLATVVSPTPGTAWSGDISTSLVSSYKSITPSMNGGSFYGFVDNGNKFVTTSGSTVTVHDVSTPYDIVATTTSTSATYNMSPYNPVIESAKFSADGTKLYLKYNYYYQDNDKNIREITCTSPFNPNGVVAGTFQGDMQSIYGGVYDMCTSHDSKKMYILNHNEIIYEYVMVTPGSIASMYWTGVSFNAATLDTNPRTIQISDDGTKMFVFGSTNNKVFELDMTTAFDLSTATYNSVNTDSFPFYDNNINGIWISADGNSITGRVDSGAVGLYYIDGRQAASLPAVVPPVGYDTSWNFDFDSIIDDKKVHGSAYHTKFVSNDGTKLYQINSSSKIVYQYELSIAHDISSAISGTYGQSSVTLSNLTDYLYNVFVSPDGINLYAIDFDNKLYHYTMSTPHDLSTATYTAVNSGVSTVTQIRNIEFNPDGSGFNIYYAEGVGIVRQYVCPTPWDITTAYWTANTYEFKTSNPAHSFQMSADGTKAYTFMREDDLVREYTMSTPWDISTMSSTPSNTHYFKNAWEVFISPDGSRAMASTDISNGYIYRTDGSYHTPVTSSGGSITWAGDITSLVDANKSFNTGYPNGWTLSDDGTKLYTMNGQRVDEHTLSIAHDISSASLDKPVQLGESPLGGMIGFMNRIHINSAGTKMFVLNDRNPRKIYQYDFGTPFDVATLTKSTSPRSDSYFKDFIGETNITDFAMSYDGKKLFHTRGDRIVERVLETAFDITTEYKTGNEYWTGDIDSSPQMLQFSSDGLKLYMFGANTDSMYEFTMTTAYDISTMSYNGTTKRVRGGSLANLSSDGTKMYVLIGTTLHQYDNS